MPFFGWRLTVRDQVSAPSLWSLCSFVAEMPEEKAIIEKPSTTLLTVWTPLSATALRAVPLTFVNSMDITVDFPRCTHDFIRRWKHQLRQNWRQE